MSTTNEDVFNRPFNIGSHALWLILHLCGLGVGKSLMTVQVLDRHQGLLDAMKWFTCKYCMKVSSYEVYYSPTAIVTGLRLWLELGEHG
jgi:hypothetical protein